MPPLQPLRILLVEDNVINQKVASLMLKKKGHVVVTVNNGREAIETLADQDFDAVLMDVQMPEMDGLQATAAIRASEEGTDRHLPILAVTAHALQRRSRTLPWRRHGRLPCQADPERAAAAAGAGAGLFCLLRPWAYRPGLWIFDPPIFPIKALDIGLHSVTVT